MDGGQSLSMKSLVRVNDRSNITIDVYRGRKTTTHTNTLFPLGKSTIPVFELPFSPVHGYRSDQAKPATGTMCPAVSKGISGCQRPKVS